MPKKPYDPNEPWEWQKLHRGHWLRRMLFSPVGWLLFLLLLVLALFATVEGEMIKSLLNTSFPISLHSGNSPNG